MKRCRKITFLIAFSLQIATGVLFAQTMSDSVRQLPEIVVTADATKEVLPPQELTGADLQKMSSFSVADAIRYFSGVQLKDYGGLGGLKTVNVRSMGSHHMGVFYNGIQLGNAQNGQIDLGKFSLDNIDYVALYHGQKSDIFQSAKEFGSAGTIYLKSKEPTFADGESTHIRASFKTGSFGLAAPSLLWEQKLPKGFSFNLSSEFISAHGKYPFRYKRVFQDKTVAYDTTAIRKNSDIKALRIESTLYKSLYRGAWDLHGYFYQSERGLPGPVVKNLFEHGQRLRDENFFIQSKLRKSFSEYYSMKLNAKYANDYTHYIDNGRDSPRAVDNQYLQHDFYLSSAHRFHLLSRLQLNVALDYQLNKMEADLVNFAYPVRHTLWGAVAGRASFRRLTLQASLLGTWVHEKVKVRGTLPPKKRATPAVMLSLKPFQEHELYLQGFYKKVFRMPTFNDLYYTFTGNEVLHPEYATQYNAGVRYTLAPKEGLLQSLSLQTDAYYNQVTNKIVAVPAGNMFRWMMLNLGKVEIGGLEMQTDATTSFYPELLTSLRLTYTYQQALDVTDKQAKNYRHQIVYIPRHSGSLVASLHYKTWGVNYSFIYTGKRYHAKVNHEQSLMQPWYTSDIGFRKEFPNLLGEYGLRASLDVNNLLDQHYDVVLNYPMPGRNWRFTLTFII